MDWPRYKFHKESEPELLEFFKAVAEQQTCDMPSDVKALWEKVLPVDESLQQKINSLRISPKPEVIDITESDDERIESPIIASKDEDTDFLLPDQSYMHLTQNISNLGLRTAEDLKNEVLDFLEIEDLLPDDVVKQLGSKLSSDELRDMFVSFATELNSEYVLKLWKSIIASEGKAQHLLIASFLQHILMRKILSKCDFGITTLFQEVFDSFPQEVTSALLTAIFQTSNAMELKKLRENLDTLSDDHKNVLLRVFEENCPKLEAHHLATLLCLLNDHTSLTNLNKLIEMMINACKDFTSDKGFGKLLLKVVQILGGRVITYEAQLKFIIGTHKSVFKTQITNIFENSLQNQRMLSQSFRI